MVNHGVIFSSMAFKLCANRVHIGMFNISSGFFKIKKIKNFDGKLTVFAFPLRFEGFSPNGGALIGNMRVRILGDLPGELSQWAEPIFIA